MQLTASVKILQYSYTQQKLEYIFVTAVLSTWLYMYLGGDLLDAVYNKNRGAIKSSKTEVAEI